VAEYRFSIPLKKSDVEKLYVGDVIFVSGSIFTARDAAHKMMLEKNVSAIPFDPSSMGLYHCGPLMRKSKGGWEVVSAGPTTSDRMDMFEDSFIGKFGVNLIIGKGSMGDKTKKALQKYTCVYTLYTGGAGALAADKIQEVKEVYWLKELGMAEAVWVFKVKDFGPLVVAIDSHGKSIYEQVKNKIRRG